ncbi:C1 family peptidase [Agromyces sp. M3QZ16-3]|uniref:C1 family peptidase n=1 Tax=Agromyces sp. M3QZ16-3 TaxID=3447585 RepID=UPI003F68C68F
MATIHDTMDYGYDPTVPEPGPVSVPPSVGPPPPSALVNADFLPPVGRQDTPSCFVWSSTYGLTTFAAARAGLITDPRSSAQQASPYYTYVKVLGQSSTPVDTCTGGQIIGCLEFLEGNGGTPSMQAAPEPAPGSSACAAVWTAYGTAQLSPDANFQPTAWSKVSVLGETGLNNIRTIVSQGYALAYGTRLYTDFAKYDGTPNPYVGNGIIAMKPNDQPVGHCMLIIGYDDTTQAVLIQNSFGSDWGSNGYVWMAYQTFQALAQGAAVYITAIQ